jgi:hypothetical protein
MSTCKTFMPLRIGDHAPPGLKRAYARAMSKARPEAYAPARGDLRIYRRSGAGTWLELSGEEAAMRSQQSVITQEQAPLGLRAALTAVVRCALSTAGLLWRHRVHLPREQVGQRFRFADGTSAPVHRDTVVDRGPVRDPCVLVVEFQLRLVRGRGHALFRQGSLLNTPLFVGFPGFVSKLWLACDECGRYRGVYEWDGPRRAQDYARALWRVLALVSVPGSVHYHVLPGLRRGDLPLALADPAAWWCPVQAA